MSHDHYGRALSDACSGYAALRPPNRVSISTGAANNLVLKQTGGAASPWSGTETPYMVEPMDMLVSRQDDSVILIGPARTGKTAGMLLGWMVQRGQRPGRHAVHSNEQGQSA